MPTATDSPTVLLAARQLEVSSTSPQTDQEWAMVTQLLLQPIHRLESAQLSDTLGLIDQPIERSVTMTNDGGALLLGLAYDWLYSALQQSIRQFSPVLVSDRLYPALQQSIRQFSPVLIGSRHIETATLSPAQIVDGSVVGKIKQPHLEAIRWIKETTGFSQERVAALLGVTRQTLNRWDRGEPIKDANRRRVFAVREVLERAVVKHSTREQLVEWLDSPRGAEGITPAQLLISGEINRARLLAVSTPSSKLSRAPVWVRRPVPAAFQAGAEHPQEAIPPELDNDLMRLAVADSGAGDQS